MKILLVTRGSQGDIYPYLTIASALIKRGHQVTLNLPQIFEKEAKAYQLDYVLQVLMIYKEWYRKQERNRKEPNLI
ncbi:glycosyltransferase [Bacteroides ovatus]|nr:glycosyltransferase [Bacteroides ovatus]